MQNESIDMEQNMTKNNTSTLNEGASSSPMEYNLHSTITADDRAAGLCYGRKLKEKIAEAMKMAGEEYESSKRK